VVNRETPSDQSDGKGILYAISIKREQSHQKNKNQWEHENSLVPTKPTGGEFHYFTEK
jgi:hypothetical protein